MRKIINLKETVFKIVVYSMFIAILSACGGNSSSEKTPENKTVTKLPAPLQKLAIGQGKLSAFVQLDGSSIRTLMEINADGNGTASVVLPGLSLSKHTVLITYEYSDSNGSLILAQVNQEVDLSSGSSVLNVDATDFSLAFDEDFDGVSNTDELLEGTDPRISNILSNNLVNLGLEVDITAINKVILGKGLLNASVALNGAQFQNMEITGDIVSATIRGLIPREYIVFIRIEYVENNRRLTLATIEQNIDLTFRGGLVKFSIADFDITSYDEDGDGASNFGELLAASDPFISAKPTKGALMTVAFEATKKFHFSWVDVNDATFYQLLENKDGASGFTQVSGNISQGKQFFDYVVPLYARTNAQYKLQSCNLAGCVQAETVAVTGSLKGSIGYFKADENQTVRRHFGSAISLSDDGLYLAVSELGSSTVDPSIYIFNNINGEWFQQIILKGVGVEWTDGFGLSMSFNSNATTLAVGAPEENGDATSTLLGNNELANNAGAVHVFVRNGNDWSQQSYIKASNAESNDGFGFSVSLSADGNVLAVGARFESSDSVGIDNVQNNNLAANSGAVYIYTRNNNIWMQQSYIKASNTGVGDLFGASVSLSADGRGLAVGAVGEDSIGVGVNNTLQINEDADGSGAVYTFIFNNTDKWTQEAYVKSNDTIRDGLFGWSVDLSADGSTLAVGARGRNAAYVFERTISWLEVAKIEPSNLDASALFGHTVSLSDNGGLLAVGDIFERGADVGINGDQQDMGGRSGAAYMFTRSTSWNQLAYIKASNASIADDFGVVELSGDGNVLAVGAPGESGLGVGINGDQTQGSALNDIGSGAVYLY